MTTLGDISITCHEGEVPGFIEAELERLYGSIYSSFPQFQIYGGAERCSTYIARRNGSVSSVLLFRRDRQHVRVVNEWIAPDADEIARFAAYVFLAYRAVNIITFPSVRTPIRELPFPFQRFACTDDNVVFLPATADDYLAQLGQATRRNIRRYLGRLTRDFPSLCWRTYSCGEIGMHLVSDIITLNRLRMAAKNKVSGIDSMETQKIARMAKVKGMVVAAIIDGRVGAGAITYRFADNYFSFVRAHDPKYDAYRLGLLCGYRLALECMERGGKELHLMWGQEPHKALLHGVRMKIDQITIYRSPMQILMNAAVAVDNACTGYMHRAVGALDGLRRFGRGGRSGY